jgi:hypothetical protein
MLCQRLHPRPDPMQVASLAPSTTSLVGRAARLAAFIHYSSSLVAPSARLVVLTPSLPRLAVCATRLPLITPSRAQEEVVAHFGHPA